MLVARFHDKLRMDDCPVHKLKEKLSKPLTVIAGAKKETARTPEGPSIAKLRLR